ncbi:hypothetical protein [Pseudomarimonas arenosa]|uniref:Cytochrome c domain-containing protein n=1 Tax=Pseudomarimonas arenosa TaxID=2774145 RepID=A0AAW3ZR12_9GAMM|nr:hypothetical protein [Pseudomarimonas arenosa]MBD8527914.1 hypothetical protein [Pseudomarimonas arenosa]
MAWFDLHHRQKTQSPAYPRALRSVRRSLPVLLLGVWACLPFQRSEAASGCQNLQGLPINFAVDWQLDVKPIINDTMGGRCSGCHNPGQFDGGFDISDDGSDAIYKIVPTYVEPGRPELSYLFQKVNCDTPDAGTRMPASQPGTAGTPLTIEQQGIIYDWIAQGALGDLEGEPPIARDFIFRDGGESLRWY